MELKITKERVLDAAGKCSTAEATLRVLFPEAFEPASRVPFDFGTDHRLNSLTDSTRSPLFIACAYAPPGMYGKCLGVDPKWEAELTRGPAGHQIIAFYPKPKSK